MTPAVELERASVFRHVAGERRYLLDQVDVRIGAGEHWAVLGPNGAGKTTLLSLVSARMHPSSGSATILGGTLGKTRVSALRRRIGIVDRRTSAQFLSSLTVLETVLTGISGSTALLPEEVGDLQIQEARRLLSVVDLATKAGDAFAVLSDGERARVLLARALVAAPELLVLDEATAGLDLPGRELFLAALAQVRGVTTILAGHHLEELPATLTHALLLKAGRVVATGPVEETLTDEALTACYGIATRITSVGGRRFASAV